MFGATLLLLNGGLVASFSFVLESSVAVGGKVRVLQHLED